MLPCCLVTAGQQQQQVAKSVKHGPRTRSGEGGVLPYMGYIGMCGPKGYGFSAVLVINRVSNLADSGHK